MLEIYSTNLTVDTDDPIAFNSSKLAKGITAVQIAPTTIQLNKKGVYLVEVSGSIVPTAAGEVSIQLAKNGNLELGSFSTDEAVLEQTSSLAFEAFVQVSQDNKPCCCAENPTTIQLINTGQPGTFSIVRMIVNKIC